ncbi:peptidase, u32 family large subunit [hydrocarbon metagenome]|uniref:Peptidase, u32 family large subunit n=1 Tax=hydrocarbon metagenome TaxID=938273 RepID=A0A0W8FIZ2_9ZZZZ|nr:U32 family peptidase [Methanomicrobiaceae archaeon]
MPLPELLAPAGSPDALKAAVAAGADAVYLGGSRFGARRYAVNFGASELEDAVNYAHAHGVSVYVTVNTLIRDAELPDVARYLLGLYEMGVDAVLLQDIGVAAIGREMVPDLRIHASTQMTIHACEGVDRAADLGFSRVVLAREVPLTEIPLIARHAAARGVGLEVFVHGALCYSYSGQCLLSSAIGGRSGNRGACAQPCRKPYNLLTGGKDEYGRARDLIPVPLAGDYSLSTRDLAVYTSLERIVSAPIEALKIEGRMRSPAYVAIVVSIYRRALDAIGRGCWSPSKEDLLDLTLAFNRGFTEGYLLSADDVMGRDMPGNRGLSIGMVEEYDPQRGEAAIRLSGRIAPMPGDGLLIRTPGRSNDGMGVVVRRAPGIRGGLCRIAVPGPVRQGSQVVLTHRASLEERARGIASEIQSPVAIDLTVTWDGGTPVLEGHLSGPGKRPLCVTMRADISMDQARTRPLTPEQIADHLGRTGGTPFVIRSLWLDYPGGLFAPAGELNRIRREFLARVTDAMQAASRPVPEALAGAQKRYEVIASDLVPPSGTGRRKAGLPDISVYVSSLDGVRGAAAGAARFICYEPRIRTVDDGQGIPAGDLPALLSEAVSICVGAESRLVWKWPAITRRRFLDAVLPLLGRAFDAGVREVMVSSPGAAAAVLRAEPRMHLSGAAGLNVWNHAALRRLSPPFRRITLSPELPAGDLAALASRANRWNGALLLEAIVQGNLEVAVTEDCLPCGAGEGWRSAFDADPEGAFWGLIDRRRRIFPLWLDGDRRTHIFNAVETCLIDHMPTLLAIGLESLAIDARGRTARYAREMSELYREAVACAAAGSNRRSRELVRLKEEVRRRSQGGITAGYFVRGLKDG